MNGAAPNLQDVLAAVFPGRVVRLALTPEQKRALRDSDGQLALDVVRHLLGARAAAAPARDRFPLTEATFQAVALKLGRAAGIKRCRVMLRRLRDARVLERAGSYRQRYRTLGVSGYRVALYRLGAVVASLTHKRSVGRGRAVKGGRRPRWWQHPLFGDASGRPPPGLTKRAAARMRSLDELESGWG